MYGARQNGHRGPYLLKARGRALRLGFNGHASLQLAIDINGSSVHGGDLIR